MNNQLIREIRIDWDRIEADSYIRHIPALQNLKEMSFASSITFFVGENGTGKSTLLEAITVAAGFNPEGGTRNYNFSTYDSHSELCDALCIVKGARKMKWGYFLRAESFYNVATKEEEYARDGHLPLEELHQRSHGESFMEIAQHNFCENSMYFLDEPEAALSAQRQMSLLKEIDYWAQRGSQFIIASHSPILTAIDNAVILSFDDGIHPCRYEETESYAVTEMFINHRERILQELLKVEEQQDRKRQ